MRSGGPLHLLSRCGFCSLPCPCEVAQEGPTTDPHSVADVCRGFMDHDADMIRVVEGRNRLRRGSAERACKSLHARIERRDLERSTSDGLRLSDQLIQSLGRVSNVDINGKNTLPIKVIRVVISTFETRP